MTKRRILYVTGTRADFGLMARTLKAIEADEGFALSILVTGMHLSPVYGSTMNEIKAAGFRIAAEVPVDLDVNTGTAMARNLGTMLIGFTDVIERERPDIVLLLGDRGEMLAAVRRGDTVVTGGGLIGKVTKVIDDNELEIDLGGGNKVTALRSTIADVRVKGEPVANQNAKK